MVFFTADVAAVRQQHSQHNKKFAIINTNDCLVASRRLSQSRALQNLMLSKKFGAGCYRGMRQECDISHQIRPCEEKMIQAVNYHLHNIAL
ncbi:hypothetical protein A8A01_20115 [Ewingella americana]|nr:hypothetical protein A8A01_20115 [Ewingella americana]